MYKINNTHRKHGPKRGQGSVRRYLLYVILPLFIVSANAAEVTQTITSGDNTITLNAEFEIANGNSEASTAVLITHGALAHNRMESIVYINELLLSKGFNTLAINLSLGISQRKGMYDCKITHRHTNADAVNEIDLWLKWLIKKDVKNIYLLGHSRGGAQTAFYAATKLQLNEESNKHVKALLLLAPAVKENTSAKAYHARYKQSLLPTIQQAREYVQHGRKHALLNDIGLMTCGKTTVTAESFLSYYETPAEVDTPSLLAKVKHPWLVIVAGDDRVVPELDKKVKPLSNGAAKQLVIIEGAGHMFRDLNADEAVDQIEKFTHQF